MSAAAACKADPDPPCEMADGRCPGPAPGSGGLPSTHEEKSARTHRPSPDTPNGDGGDAMLVLSIKRREWCRGGQLIVRTLEAAIARRLDRQGAPSSLGQDVQP